MVVDATLERPMFVAEPRAPPVPSCRGTGRGGTSRGSPALTPGLACWSRWQTALKSGDEEVIHALPAGKTYLDLLP